MKTIAIQVNSELKSAVSIIETEINPQYLQKYETGAITGESDIITFLIVLAPAIVHVVGKVIREKLKTDIELKKVKVIINGNYIEGPVEDLIEVIKEQSKMQNQNKEPKDNDEIQ